MRRGGREQGALKRRQPDIRTVAVDQHSRRRQNLAETATKLLKKGHSHCRHGTLGTERVPVPPGRPVRLFTAVTLLSII